MLGHRPGVASPLPPLRPGPDCVYPDHWTDPKSRSTVGFYNLHDRSIGVQNSAFYVLDPPAGLGTCMYIHTFTFLYVMFAFLCSCFLLLCVCVRVGICVP